MSRVWAKVLRVTNTELTNQRKRLVWAIEIIELKLLLKVKAISQPFLNKEPGAP